MQEQGLIAQLSAIIVIQTRKQTVVNMMDFICNQSLMFFCDPDERVLERRNKSSLVRLCGGGC